MLKKKRIKMNLSIEELSEKLNIKEDYLKKLENCPNMCDPDIRLIIKLSETLKLNPVKVFTFFINNREK
ncbi:helix-turn-helix transcriptional regulator [uncultured Clostridium sp.]|uniref:helix-turn-helix domain-containing protein n=1 Tax=uncultured Clostridium sp. TaxID=59620 RepID=UPI0028E95B64|nr:helix-turn-helix transcriptional regulator [uncultured Clostridium sp.]